MSKYPPAEKEYSPELYHYKCWLEIRGSETGPEETYADDVTEVLYNGGGYAALRQVRPPRELSQEKAEAILSRQIFLYLESSNKLPAFPVPADWVAKIKAPVEYIDRLVNEHGLGSVTDYLPYMEQGTLPPFFDKAAEQVYERMGSLNNIPGQGSLMSKKQIHQRLTALASGFSNSLMGHPYPQLAQYIADFYQTFGPKVRRYEEDRRKVREGVFDALLAEAKQRKLTKKEAIDFIVYDYLS